MENFRDKDSTNLLSSGSGFAENDSLLNATCGEDISVDVYFDSNFPSPVAIVAKIIQSLFGITLIFVGVFLNSLILFLLYKFKKLRKTSFHIAIQLAVVNHVLAVIYGISTIISYVANRWILGVELCVGIGALTYLIYNVRAILIFIFSVDRFLMVFLPFRYPKHSCKVVSLLSLLAWSLCGTYIITNVQFSCFGFSQYSLSCVINFKCNKACEIVFFTFFSAITTPCIFIPIGLLLALYLKGRRIRQADMDLGLDEKMIADQEWRAIKTCLLLVVDIFVLQFVPITLFLLADFFGPVGGKLTTVFASDIIVTFIITDPIILMRNPDVEEALKEIMESLRSYCRNRLPSNQEAAASN